MIFTDVTAAVIRKNEKVLIAQRALGEQLEKFWEFPGGKIEKGETPEQCIGPQKKCFIPSCWSFGPPSLLR